MGVPLHVKQWMRGYVGLGVTDPAQGARIGLQQDLRFEHHATIRIADIDEFVADARHEAELAGHVECSALGGRCELTSGTFHMLVDADDPIVKYTFYRAALVNGEGKPFTMLGHHTLRDDRGLDVWEDLTTLEIHVFEGHDVQGPPWPSAALGPIEAWPRPPIAAGVLHIGFFDAMRSALSFESPGASRADAMVAARRFCAFTGSRLWDLYAKLRPRAARADEWTATEAFQSTQKLAPVKWLLAGDLLQSAARIVRSMLTNELDLRDWMAHDRPIDLRRGWPAELLDEPEGGGPAAALGGGPTAADPADELWFDYIADTGDDPKAFETLATLMGKDLAPDQLALCPGIERPARTLEAGPFVFVGGDTAYHVADEMTLRRRFVEPFKRSLGLTGEPGQTLKIERGRLLFGIPGNHDYYDHLVGFNRMFRRPYRQRESLLHIPGFELRQEASYVKILLPGGWQLWGLDLASGLDYRQWRYFNKLPDKVILCVATPPVTFDKVRVPGDRMDVENRAYRRLFRLPGDARLDFTPAAVEEALAPGQCRLHLAGDDHHYARYDASRAAGRDAGRDAGPAAEPAAASAVSIVSGGGGAFLHPTETSRGDVYRSATYPSVRDSSQISSKLVDPRVMLSAGLVYLAGAALGALLYWTFPRSWRAMGPAWMWLVTVGAAVGALYGAYALNHRILFARKRVAKAKRPRVVVLPGSDLPPPTWWDRLLTLQAVQPGVWIAALLFALSAPFLVKVFEPRLDPLSSDSVFVVLVTVMTMALVRFARSSGWNAVGGALHAVVQLGMPLALVLHGTWIGYAIVAGLWIVFVACAGRLYRAVHARGIGEQRRGLAWLLGALWVLQGPGAAVALWLVPDLGIAAPVLPHEGWVTAIASVVGAVVATVQFSWYLLVAAAFGAHNNELGAALRSSRYKHWIRFHVTKDALTGYVIGVDDPLGGATPKLVDVFRVVPKPAQAAAAPQATSQAA